MEDADAETGESAITEYMSLVGQRPDFLEYLCENPADKRDIIDDLGYSRSTVDRAISDLQEAGLVRYEDGKYVTAATGVLAVKQYRAYIDQSEDIRTAHDALEPLPPDTRLDPAMAIGASVNLAEGPRPYDALNPLQSALRNASQVRAILPNVADARHIKLYQQCVETGVNVEIALSQRLRSTLTEQFPEACGEMASYSEFDAFEGEVTPFGVVITDEEGVSTVSVVVYTDSGSVHAVIHVGTIDAVRWAENLYEEVIADAENITESFRSLRTENTDSYSPNGGSTLLSKRSQSVAHSSLPLAVESEGFVELTPQYFNRREANDPITCWRTGLGIPDVAAGYAVDRTREQDDERENLTETLLRGLKQGKDYALLGPLGAGKSTVCKSIAYRWYDRGIGPVLYRESGRMEDFNSVAELRSAIEERGGHVLVVVEDAVRAEASDVFRLAQQFDGHDRVTFLLDARESEWSDPQSIPVDARLDTLRTSGIETVRLPNVDTTECARFIEHFEETTGVTVPMDEQQLLDDIRRDTGGTAERKGEVLLLFHRLSRYATSQPETGESTPTAFLEDVQRAYQKATNSDGQYSIEVSVLVNLLNAAQIGIYPEYVHSLADEDKHEAVEQQLESLYGSVIFSDPATEDALAPLQSIHETWSAEFLLQLLDSMSQRQAHRIFADCLSPLLSLADDVEHRTNIEWFFEGETDRLDILTDNPTEWCDTILEQVFALGIKRPALAPLYGKTEYSRLTLPEACSEETRLRCSLWRGQMNLEAGTLDRAQHEFETVLDGLSDVSCSDETRERLRATANYHLGRTFLAKGEDEQADTVLKEAESQYRSLQDESGAAGCLVERGLAIKRQGHINGAEQQFRDALGIYRNHPDVEREAKCLFELGMVLHRQGDPETGHEHVNRALDKYRETGSRSSEARCLNGLGTIATHQGQLDNAEEYFSTSIEIAREIGNQRSAANTLVNLSNVLKARGDYEQSNEYLHEALPVFQEIGDEKGEAAAYHNLGRNAEECDELDDAEEFLEQAIEIRERNGHERRLARSRHNLGVVYLKREEFDKARELFEQCLDQFQEFNEPRMVCASLRALGELEHRESKVERAEELLKESIDTAKSANAIDYAIESYDWLVSVYEEAGRIDAAIHHCKEAISLAKDHDIEEQVEEFKQRCQELEDTEMAAD